MPGQLGKEKPQPKPGLSTNSIEAAAQLPSGTLLAPHRVVKLPGAQRTKAPPLKADLVRPFYPQLWTFRGAVGMV